MRAAMTTCSYGHDECRTLLTHLAARYVNTARVAGIVTAAFARRVAKCDNHIAVSTFARPTV